MGSPPDNQIHDLNPGISQSGLFWTTVVASDSISVDLESGVATIQLESVHLFDYTSLANAFLGGGPQPVPSVLSFKVMWDCTGTPTHFDNPAQQFRGDFKFGTAQMEWSARIGGLEYQSDPLSASSSSYAQLGNEQNGSYY